TVIGGEGGLAGRAEQAHELTTGVPGALLVAGALRRSHLAQGGREGGEQRLGTHQFDGRVTAEPVVAGVARQRVAAALVRLAVADAADQVLLVAAGGGELTGQLV